MVTSKRLQPVQRVAKSREQTAARELGDSRRRSQEQEQRLDELRRYHREYLKRFHDAAKTGMSATQLQEYRAFLAKLEMAIQEQEKVVKLGHTECSERKEEWQQKHVRTQVLDKVVERHRKEERKAVDTREQKESDDRNQRRIT